MIKLLSNGGDINVPDEYTVCLFLRKLKCPGLSSLFSEVLVTLLEEKVLISDLPKVGNSSISMRKVIVTSILQRLDQENDFF